MTTIEQRFVEDNIPDLGVSQWKAFGKKYGYWDYFRDQEIKKERQRIYDRFVNTDKDIDFEEFKQIIFLTNLKKNL